MGINTDREQALLQRYLDDAYEHGQYDLNLASVKERLGLSVEGRDHDVRNRTAELVNRPSFQPSGTSIEVRGSGRFGKQVLEVIGVDNGLDARRAELNGPRIPGGQGNGKA